MNNERNRIPSTLPSLPLITQLANIQSETLTLFTKKHKEYKACIEAYGHVKMLETLKDKLSTFCNTKSNIFEKNTYEFDKLRQELMELQNYSALLIMKLDDNMDIRKELDKNVIRVSRDMDTDEIIKRVMRGEVLRFE
jgi:myosin heavy subunit